MLSQSDDAKREAVCQGVSGTRPSAPVIGFVGPSSQWYKKFGDCSITLAIAPMASLKLNASAERTVLNNASKSLCSSAAIGRRYACRPKLVTNCVAQAASCAAEGALQPAG